jgi:hypothetical protein
LRRHSAIPGLRKELREGRGTHYKRAPLSE